MSITDELREWNRRYAYFKADLTAIADRIDTEYERMHEALTIGMEPMTEENMARDGWVKLPVDADGKVIHVEDEVELLDGSKRFKAEWLEWDGEDWAVHETIGYGAYHEPSSLRHVQPDTWERIIEDAMQYARTTNMPYPAISIKGDELVERCRRLAGAE